MNRNLFVFFLATLFFLKSFALLAQSVNPEKLKTLFPEADAVFLEQSEQWTLDYQNDEWNIVQNTLEELYFLENAAQIYAQQHIYYSSFDEITDIDARTLVPNGKKFKTQKVETIETKDVMSGSIFYSDHKNKQFVFPSVQQGAITHLSYKRTSTEPRLLGAYYFSSYAPILKSEFTVHVPEHIKITYKVLGENTDKIQFSEKTNKGGTTYKWTATNMDKIAPEANAPSASYYMPHVVVYINSAINSKGETVSVIKDVSDLYSWYADLVKDVNGSEDAELKRLVGELTEGLTTDIDKVKAIFQWVQQNIKYVAFEDGLGGFIPREAAAVCQKKYGDCKDMSSIMVEMMNIAGINAHLTWIGTRDKPYTYNEVPTPIVDNHMIASAKINGEYVFLDATGENQPFGMPTSMIQGKEALIGIDAETYKIITVPVIAKDRNLDKEIIHLTIDDRNLKGSGTTQLTGYKKVFAEYARMRAISNASDQYFNEYLRKGSNKFEAKNVEETGFFDKNEDIQIKYDFEIPGYAKKAGSKIYVNLNLNQAYKDQEIDLKKRKFDKEVEYKHIEDTNITLDIPAGYAVDYLPENAKFDHELFGFNIEYAQKNGQVFVSQQLYIDFLILKRADFETWNQMIDLLSKAYQEVVVLKEIGE